MNERACEACGVKIVFAKGASGRAIPLQRIRNIYQLSESGDAVKVSEFSDATYVSHFETCTNPGRFSRKGKQP